jgi:large subunit ribosomal protein L21
MYAVFATGGQQYKGAVGDKFKVEKLAVEAGSSVDFEVLLVSDGEGNIKVGDPVLKGAKVEAKVVNHARGDKIRVQKFKRRKHYDKVTGHRQDYTEIEITDIKG